MIACVIERDKLHTAILAAPVEVRNLQVHFERLRDGRQLHMIGFLPQDLDDNFAKFFDAHRFSGVGMCQEGLIRFWLALNLRTSDHTHERDQIIGRAFILELLEKLRRSQGCPGSRDWLWVYDPSDQVPWDLVALVDHHVCEPNVPQLRQETFKCRYGELDSNLSIFLEKYAFYVRKDKSCIVVKSQSTPRDGARREDSGGDRHR